MEDNNNLEMLEILKQKAEELNSEKKETIKAIRAGFVDKAILFIDMVGSTSFKQEHNENPEIWILRNKQFSDLLREIIIKSNGVVIKYIGDEIMASYENTYDAQNLIGRIEEIEENLKKATGYETKIKTAIDFGKVYELKFDGHEPKDPHSSVVDRCARISKYATAGEVVASATFVGETPKLNWKKLGTVELKGLGPQQIYQLEHATILIDEKIEINKDKYEKIVEENEDLKIEIAKITNINKELNEKINQLGGEIDKSLMVEASDDIWEYIGEEIKELRKVIEPLGKDLREYARFLFLYYSKDVGQKYNSMNGKEFDTLIESDIVESNDDNYFILNTDNKRNIKALKIIEEIDDGILDYLLENEQDPDDLFDWSMKDSGFWKKYIDYNVL